jgi:hypothetical protein
VRPAAAEKAKGWVPLSAERLIHPTVLDHLAWLTTVACEDRESEIKFRITINDPLFDLIYTPADRSISLADDGKDGEQFLLLGEGQEH